MQQLALKQALDPLESKICLNELVDIVSDYYKIRKSDLNTRSQNRLLSKVRLTISKIAIEFRVANLTEVAKYFQRDVSTFSRGLSKMLTFNDDEFDEIMKIVKSANIQA